MIVLSFRSLEALCEPVCLVQPDSNLSFVYHTPIDALMCVELPNYEYLLVFSQLGIFVNSKGKKSRERELMFASAPIYVSLRDEVRGAKAENNIKLAFTHYYVFELKYVSITNCNH